MCLRRGSIECNTTLTRERFLRPDGSEVLAVNSPVDGSNVPEEPSPAADDPEGGAVLARGAELSEVELVLATVVAVLVEFVSVEEESVELMSVELFPEPMPVELSAEGVVVELSDELVGSEDVELVWLVQLLADATLERSVPFMLDRRP